MPRSTLSLSSQQYRQAMKDPDRIILVYSAESGLFNAINDWLQKAFSSECRGCRLCYFTHSLTGMRQPWKDFIQSLPCDVAFLHRPEFEQAYPESKATLPAIFAERDGTPEVLVSAEEIADLENLTELIEFTCERFFGTDYKTLLDNEASPDAK